MTTKILHGDCRETLKTLPDQSVHCCVTSPPYFGLRDYGHDGQIGLEPTPDEFVGKLVEVFREVRRVLRDDGTLWLNLGDSYARNAGPEESKLASLHTMGVGQKRAHEMGAMRKGENKPPPGLKPKDLIGIPWRVAFALQADGWYLRQDIIWHKPNPMPESVQDRCTKSHEYIFLLSKTQDYYYNNAAISEQVSQVQPPRRFGRKEYEKAQSDGGHSAVREVAIQLGQGTETSMGNHYGRIFGGHSTRNKRSVWTVNVRPYKEAHFATYPPELIKPCILAGCPDGGTVLDPFGGSGTTAQVAMENNRNAILCELNGEYIDLIKKRLAAIQPELI